MNIVGIPQGLLYHEFGSFWQSYFDTAGIKTILSEPTTKVILNEGTNLAVDESCLPLKIYLGHVQSLLNKCTHIFVPRTSHYHEDYYFCAKFAGLPDIVRNTFNLNPNRLLSPNIEGSSLLKIWKECHAVGKKIGISPLKSYWAYQYAKKSSKQAAPPQLLEKDKNIAILGHSYLLKDPFFSAGILPVLSARNMQPIFPDQVPAKISYRLATQNHPDVYWQLSAKLVGAAHFFSHQTSIKGILAISSFGCGPDSLINEYLDYHVLRKSGIPYTYINFDEHTGNAGVITRLEAFLDVVEWRDSQ
jgi:predicted nucleotide-binding protein (sugar kinase/HSP70/actin superfamily)